MDPGELPDDRLVVEMKKRVGSAREAVIEELFARHYVRVGRWCYRFTGNRELAADLAQDVFLKAHRYLDTFKGTAQFSTWLYSIVRNEAASRLKSVEPPMEQEELLGQIAGLDPDPEELATRQSRASRLKQFLAASLSETERTVFTLHYGDELPLETITQLLNLTNTSGAKAYIVSARRKLARASKRLTARGEEV
jgi:RNA polymerase sigma-70 factor (ECF subfamily)